MAASAASSGGGWCAAEAALCPCARVWVDLAPAPVHAPRRPLRRSLSLPSRPPAPGLAPAAAAAAAALGPPPAYDDDHQRTPPPEPCRLAVGHPEPPPPYSPAGVFCISAAPRDCFDSLPVARQPAPCTYADEQRSTGMYCCVLTWTIVLLGAAVAQYFFF